MIKQRKGIKENLIAIVLALVCLIAPMLNITIGQAYADEVTYSYVLDDLRKDENFKLEDYPVKDNDYSLSLVQIAESTAKELFIYVYNPSTDRVATEIRFSTLAGDNAQWIDYDLILLNKSETLSKYKVENFVVSNESERIYDIVQIVRAWDELIDEELDGDNKASTVPYKVGRQYTVYTEDDKVYYSYLDSEVIEISDKFVGFVRYEDGSLGVPGVASWYFPGSDSHFVAFSTDKDIDRLYNVKLTYETQLYKYHYDIYVDVPCNHKTTYSEIEEKPADISYTDKTSVDGFKGGKYNTYTFDRIQTVEDFIATETLTNVYNGWFFDAELTTNITDFGLKNLQNKQWVLRFAETVYFNDTILNYGSGFHETHYTKVSNVSILQLTFETNGVSYNLGVVDNKQTGSDTPINETIEKKRPKWWVWLIIAILVVVVLSILSPFLKPVFEFIVWIFGKIFQGIWWLITLPYQIIKKRKG